MAAFTPPDSFGPNLPFTWGVRGGSFFGDKKIGADDEGEEAYGLSTVDGSWVVGSQEAELAGTRAGVAWIGSTDDTVVFNSSTECVYLSQCPFTPS